MLKIKQKGNFEKTLNFLSKSKKPITLEKLEKYGDMGVAALMDATPVDSGLTRASWYYQITETKDKVYLKFCNSHIEDNVPIAIILQYGHGTGTGGWVAGRDYINPAIQPVFDKLAKNAWEEVIKT